MTKPTRARNGPTVSLISGMNGRPTRKHAGKAFSCHHCDAPFAKGDPYVAIPQRKGAPIVVSHDESLAPYFDRVLEIAV